MTDSTQRKIDIRPGGGDSDARVILGLFDSAIAWLVARGRTGQWGSKPASEQQRYIDHAKRYGASDDLYIAMVDGKPVGALAVGDAHGYAPAATEPELYVQLLLTDRDYAGLGVGARLLDHARKLARERQRGLLRVDCYAGDDRALVGYYESQGFTATEPFTVDLEDRVWPGQLLEQRL